MGKRKARACAFPGVAGEALETIIEQTPLKYRGVYERALTGKATQKGAIQATCCECCAFEDLPHRIYDCTSYRCPLWAYRPQPNRYGKKVTK